MSETATFRKNKIELTEYDYSKDILNRVLMASFSAQEIEVLEEILYSSLRIPVEVLQNNLDLPKNELNPILEKLSQTGLFKIATDHVLVDKEMRKYYESQILKFEEDFKPGMEYLQALMRKVPIHVLPNWYSISRTSNNIFESIVEKYLLTPQIYQRYLLDLNLTDPIQQGIMNALYQSPDYELDAANIIEQHNLSQEQFEEHMLHLEFSFVCCIQFIREKDQYRQIITPFQEWKDYLLHVKKTEPTSIEEEKDVERDRTSDFAVVEEISAILELSQTKPIADRDYQKLQDQFPNLDQDAFSYYLEKLSTLNLLEEQRGVYSPTSDTVGWLKMDLINRALYLYRHPLNYLNENDLPEYLCQHKLIREAEKCVARAVDLGWIDLDYFLEGIFIPLREHHPIQLVRHGRTWKYQIPQYSEEELNFFRAIVQNWLFELGITATGSCNGRDCFTLTPLGQDLFSNE